MTVGPIPILLGARLIEGKWEQDNSFEGMLLRNFLYDASINTVYPGALAYKFCIWNHDRHNGSHPEHTWGWIEWASRGIPHMVFKCKNLMFKVVTNPNANALDRFEAWMILSEFVYLSRFFAQAQCDHAMCWVTTGLGMLCRPSL